MKGRVFVLGAAVAAGSMVLGASAPAQAQDSRQDPLGSRRKPYESTQRFAYELRFAPFIPDVDSNPRLNGATPFKDTLHDSARIMFQMELDYQILRIPHFGTLGPGVGVGYTKMSGDAQFVAPHGPNGITTSGETTSLTLFPLYAVAVLRADVIWRELHTPIVPYAKLGLGYTLWRASNTVGTSVYDGKSGVGGSLGTQLGLGLAFNLNSFDEYSAKNFDEAVGVNNTYAFVEYTRADLDGLGIQSNPMRVGGQSWTFGLTVEF